MHKGHTVELSVMLTLVVRAGQKPDTMAGTVTSRLELPLVLSHESHISSWFIWEVSDSEQLLPPVEWALQFLPGPVFHPSHYFTHVLGSSMNMNRCPYSIWILLWNLDLTCFSSPLGTMWDSTSLGGGGDQLWRTRPKRKDVKPLDHAWISLHTP